MVFNSLAEQRRHHHSSFLKLGTDHNLFLLEELIVSTQQCRPDVMGAGSSSYVPRNFPPISSVPVMILFLILFKLPDISRDRKNTQTHPDS